MFKGPEKQIRLTKILYIASEAIIEKKSYFKAFVVETESVEKVQYAYTSFAWICGDSDHMMYVYSVRVNGRDASDYVDDRGHDEGVKLRSATEHKNLINVAA